MLRIGHLEVFVRDPAVARDFYRDVLGFEVAQEQGDGAFVWLDAPGLTILLRPGRDAPERTGAAEYGRAPAAIVLYTDDLPATRAALEARGLVFEGEDGSPSCPTFRDPDGHWFQLVDPANH